MRTSTKKQVQKDPDQSEEAFRALVNATRETLLLIDARGTILLANETAAERIGKSVQELVGTCLYDYSPPELAKSRKEQHNKVFTTGEPVHFEDTRAGRFYETYCYPVFDKKEKVSRATIFAYDITGRKLREEELRQAVERLKVSEDKYRNIVENAVEGIFQTTPEGRYISVNPYLARMIGYDTPEELMEGITDLSKQGYVNSEDRVTYKKIIVEEGVIYGFETQHYRKDGSIIWVSINARVVRDPTGKVLYYEGTIENITDRKMADNNFKQNVEKLRKSLLGSIKALSMMVEARDPYTSGHQRKVARLARVIAQEIGLPNDTVDTIRMAGVIHDIGKVSVPAEILAKPGKITGAEMSIIKVHSQSGYDILKDAELPYPIAEIVLQHHERLNGSGYPQGLKNGQILLESQIIAVADVIEAMASHRPYRPAIGIDVALEEIEANKGIFYNTKAVDACVRLFREKGFTFETTAS